MTWADGVRALTSWRAKEAAGGEGGRSSKIRGDGRAEVWWLLGYCTRRGWREALAWWKRKYKLVLGRLRTGNEVQRQCQQPGGCSEATGESAARATRALEVSTGF